MLRSKIVSTGLYMPKKIQTAGELAPIIGKSEDWIISQAGVRERRIAEEPMEVLAAKAALQAIGKGPLPDLLLNASTTPRQLIPDSSVFIQKELGLKGIPSWSTHATCLSFLMAMLTGASLIGNELYKRVLVVSSETGTPFRDLRQPESAALFGDGAAAAIVEGTPDTEQSAILDWEMATFPEAAELTELRGGGTRRPPYRPGTKPEDYLFQMNGPRVFRLAVIQCMRVLEKIFKRNHMDKEDIDWIIPHQTSGPGMEAYAKYGFAREKIINNIALYGNCIAASIPIALATANADGKLKRGDLILMGGTGAGLSVSFALVRW
jgi:3-oxoacyl-[acyl-carrier-protein] synthase-3